MKKRAYFTIGALIVIALALAISLQQTGLFQESEIDVRDLTYWNYENGVIIGAEEYTLKGSNETCWILIHGYTSTPTEMELLAKAVNKEFNDFVYAPRLKGHGEVPSHVLEENISTWYKQIEEIYLDLNKSCGKINVAGSSIGGALALKLATEHELKNIYLVNPFLYTVYKFYRGLPSKTYIRLFGGITKYNKKTQVAQINDPAGLEVHIAYWNMPYVPMKNSFDYINDLMNNLGEIEEAILIQHSINDKTAGKTTVMRIQEEAGSDEIEVVWFEKSNHVLLRDYDKEQVINNIIEFEKSHR